MKKLIIKIGNETHELPYSDEVFSFEMSGKYEPKVGDCVRVNLGGDSIFFKILPSKDDGYINSEHRVDLYKGEYKINLGDFSFLYETRFTQITPEELKAKYAEAGYDWDCETNVVNPLKRMPKDGDKCWVLGSFLQPRFFIYNSSSSWFSKVQEKGLLFQTEAECQKFADHCLKYFDKK